MLLFLKYNNNSKDTQKDLLYKNDLFTNAEKIIYSKLRINYKEINNNDEMNLEAFTYRNIDTDYQEEKILMMIYIIMMLI